MVKIRSYFTDGEWYVAIRKHNCAPIEMQHSFEVNLLNNTWRYWCADPFVFKKNGITYIFMEIFDKIKRQGLIGYRTLEPNGNVSKIVPCLDIGKHMSYPFIFEKNENVYMMPECYQSECLTVYRAEQFPDKWVKDTVLLENVRVCDSNLMEMDGRQYLSTMKIHGNPFQYDQMYMFYSENGRWIECENVPAVVGEEKARNGGAYFFDHGRFLRPAQNCTNSYGESLSFFQVEKLTQSKYEERLIAKLQINDVTVRNSRKKFDGIHTYNTNGEFDVIDLRVTNSFQSAHFFGLVITKVISILRRMI